MTTPATPRRRIGLLGTGVVGETLGTRFISLDTPEAGEAAVHALTGGGFLESEVTLTCGWRERIAINRAYGKVTAPKLH